MRIIWIVLGLYFLNSVSKKEKNDEKENSFLNQFADLSLSTKPTLDTNAVTDLIQDQGDIIIDPNDVHQQPRVYPASLFREDKTPHRKFGLRVKFIKDPPTYENVLEKMPSNIAYTIEESNAEVIV